MEWTFSTCDHPVSHASGLLPSGRPRVEAVAAGAVSPESPTMPSHIRGVQRTMRLRGLSTICNWMVAWSWGALRGTPRDRDISHCPRCLVECPPCRTALSAGTRLLTPLREPRGSSGRSPRLLMTGRAGLFRSSSYLWLTVGPRTRWAGSVWALPSLRVQTTTLPTASLWSPPGRAGVKSLYIFPTDLPAVADANARSAVHTKKTSGSCRCRLFMIPLPPQWGNGCGGNKEPL